MFICKFDLAWAFKYKEELSEKSLSLSLARHLI